MSKNELNWCFSSNASRKLLIPVCLLVLSGWLAEPQSTGAQTVTILSVSPANGATGVSGTAPVAVTFSGAVYSGSAVLFTNASNPVIPAMPAWNANYTVLTYTPVGSWPANSTIGWTIYAYDLAFQPVGGTTTGAFSTGSGSGGGGIGTNRYSGFNLIRSISYNQFGTGASVLDTNLTYTLFGVANLASNRTVTSATLTMPTSGVSNLFNYPYPPNNNYSLSYGTTNLSNIDALFPPGAYTFYVQGPNSNQTLNLTFPTTTALALPNAPHVSNYSAAQAINPALAFTLTWDPFTAGTVTDYVSLLIQSSGPDVFRSPDVLTQGALNGTSTSVNIPAGTLQSGSNYTGSLSFFKSILTTNSSGDNTTWVARVASTTFNVATFGGGPLVITNCGILGSNLVFNVRCQPSQTFTIYSASNLTTAPWFPRLTTNATGTLVRFLDPSATTNRTMFYRIKNGAQ
jgi:hypothetical protein